MTPYHLGPVLLVAGVLVAVAFAVALRTVIERQARAWLVVAAVVVVLLVPAGLAKKVRGGLGPQLRWQLGRVSTAELLTPYAGSSGSGVSVQRATELAQYVRETVPEGGKVLFWGYSTLVNYLAGRPAPTRFSDFALVSEIDPRFSQYEKWTQEVRGSLLDRPPAMILLVREPGQAGYRYLGGLHGELVAALVKERYTLDRAIGPVDLYRLMPRSESAN
jgi:hypothetical protein